MVFCHSTPAHFGSLQRVRFSLYSGGRRNSTGLALFHVNRKRDGAVSRETAPSFRKTAMASAYGAPLLGNSDGQQDGVLLRLWRLQLACTPALFSSWTVPGSPCRAAVRWSSGSSRGSRARACRSVQPCSCSRVRDIGREAEQAQLVGRRRLGLADAAGRLLLRQMVGLDQAAARWPPPQSWDPPLEGSPPGPAKKSPGCPR